MRKQKKFITLAPGIVSTIGVGARKHRIVVVDQEFADGRELICENCVFWEKQYDKLGICTGFACSMDGETKKLLGECKADKRMDGQDVIFNELKG